MNRFFLILLFCFLFASQFLQAQIVVDFSVDNQEGCNVVQSQFTDLSSSTEGSIIEWEWSLGDVASTIKNPGRIFSEPGLYEICLTVKDEKGNQKTSCNQDYIRVYEMPSADFSFDITAGCSPLSVQFSDLSLSPNGQLFKWEWGLGGSNSTIVTFDTDEPIFTTYENDGLQTVSLIVTDDKGCFNAVTKQNIIQVEEKPEIIIGTVDPIGCTFPMLVDFENFGNEVNVIYDWEFGNGEFFTGFNPEAISYPSQGNYDVVVRSRFADSDCTNEIILENYVSSGGNILFDFSPKLGCNGLEVQFIDESALDAETWLWSFGDGETSTERDPIHKYANAGSYDISLFRDTGECSGTKASSKQVVVYDSPAISASFDNFGGCLLPAVVSFSAISEPNVDYSWFIESDGSAIFQGNGSIGQYSFEEYGDYFIKVSARNAGGCVSTSLLDTIKIQPLEASFSGVYQGCVPFEASLSIATNSLSPIKDVSWDVEGPWTFTSTPSLLTFLVDETGNYDATAIVENDIGCIDTVNVLDLVSGGDSPVVDFSLSDTNVCPRELIQFTNLSAGNIESWIWEIGDTLIFETEDFASEVNIPGSYDVKLTAFSNGCQVSITKEDFLTVSPPGANIELINNCENPNQVIAIDGSTFSDGNEWKYVINGDTTLVSDVDTLTIELPGNGTYFISMEAFNNASGCTNIAFDDIEVTQPKADFIIDKKVGCAPIEVNFYDNSSFATEWEYFTNSGVFFNSTSPDSKLNIKFGGIYEEIGLIVRDIHGCSDTTFSEPISVNNLQAKFDAPMPVCFSDTLSIVNQSIANLADITSYLWVLGDGIAVSSDEEANFLAPEIGKYDLKLIVEDSWGCTDSVTLGLGAYFRSPNFELITDSLACTTAEVRFRNGLHSAGYQYLWDFGDGKTSTEINPLHLYSAEGEYQVNVLIEDNSNCANTMDLTDIIKVLDPIAGFTVDATFSACPPLIPNFTNTSENAIEFQWYFGDGTGLDNTESPSHLYTYSDFFDVTLIAIRSEECSDTIIFNDLIELDGPKGEINFEVDSSCVPLSVNFEAKLEENYTMTWDFGDGNLEVLPAPTNFSVIVHTYLNGGNFIPKIILTNEDNCTIIREGENIQTQDLAADFSMTDSVFCDSLPLEVGLIDISESTGEIVQHTWMIEGSEDIVLEGLNPSFTPQDTGFSSITLIVSNHFCTDSITKENILRIGESPVLDLQSDTFSCLGNEFDLSALEGFIDNSIVWSDVLGPLEKKEVSPTESMFFYLEASNQFLCNSRDSIFLEIINDQTRFAGEDRMICKGADTEITINYSDEVFWPSILNCFNCTTVALSPDSTTLYPVIATNDFGCLVKDSIEIIVLSEKDIEAGDDQRICIADTPLLLAFVPGDIQWSPANLVSSPNEQLTTVDILETTLFTLTSTAGECTLTDSVLIELIGKAELEVRGDTICFGELAQLFAGGSVDQVSWNLDESLSNPNISNPTSNTIQDREFMVVGELDGCASDTALVLVKVLQEIEVRLPDEFLYFPGETAVDINLKLPSNGNFLIDWDDGGAMSCSNCDKLTISVNGDTKNVEITIVNEETGCRIQKRVVLRAYNSCQEAANTIAVPNIFSPNEDGVNDFLEIRSSTFDDISSIHIFDRWGQKTFHGRSIADAWDGKLGNTNALQGVYSYRITAKCPTDGSIIYKTGSLTLIR